MRIKCSIGLTRGTLGALAIVLGAGISCPMAGASQPIRLRDFRPARTSVPASLLPTYSGLTQLTPQARTQVLRALREFLIDTETEALIEDGRESARLLDFWIATAVAGGRTPTFCINLGVVKPLDQCSPQGSPAMHDFDTTELLKPIGAEVADCGGKGFPCSPVFGFDSGGKLFCTDTNRTRTCARMSGAEGTISFESVMDKCGSLKPGEKPDKPAVDCDRLKEFYDKQIELVQGHCAKSPSRKACGILRSRLGEITRPAQSPDEVKDAAAQAAKTAEAAAEAAKMRTSDPCAEAPAKSGAARAPKGCVQGRFPEKGSPRFAQILQTLPEIQGPKGCSEVEVPGVGRLRVQSAGDKHLELKLYPKTEGEKSPQPVSVDPLDVDVMELVSANMLNQKQSLRDAVRAYLPAGAIGPSGELEVQTKDGAKKIPLRGWKSPDGSEIRYVASRAQEAGKIAVRIWLKDKDGKETDKSFKIEE